MKDRSTECEPVSGWVRNSRDRYDITVTPGIALIRRLRLGLFVLPFVLPPTSICAYVIANGEIDTLPRHQRSTEERHIRGYISKTMLF